jgi:hypothetical protein
VTENFRNLVWRASGIGEPNAAGVPQSVRRVSFLNAGFIAPPPKAAAKRALAERLPFLVHNETQIGLRLVGKDCGNPGQQRDRNCVPVLGLFQSKTNPEPPRTLRIRPDMLWTEQQMVTAPDAEVEQDFEAKPCQAANWMALAEALDLLFFPSNVRLIGSGRPLDALYRTFDTGESQQPS